VRRKTDVEGTEGRKCAVWLAALVVSLCSTGCRSTETAVTMAREYELRGQVIAVRPEIGEIRIKHEAIPGYMDAMTMSFRVKDRRLLDGRARGDLVRGRLMVTNANAWLSALEKTGTDAVIDDAEPASGPAMAFALLEPGQSVPDESFVNQDGKPWRPSSLGGKAFAMTFIYTRCPLPTYCPMMDRNFRAAQQQIAARPAVHDNVRFITVSLDPDFDTPRVMRKHAESIGADLSTWTFVTARPTVVDAFGTKFGLSVMRGDKAFADITHNLRTAIVAPTGKLVKVYNGNDWTAGQLVADLTTASALQ
jgi:protein SCO1/2